MIPIDKFYFAIANELPQILSVDDEVFEHVLSVLKCSDYLCSNPIFVPRCLKKTSVFPFIFFLVAFAPVAANPIILSVYFEMDAYMVFSERVEEYFAEFVELLFLFLFRRFFHRFAVFASSRIFSRSFRCPLVKACGFLGYFPGTQW